MKYSFLGARVPGMKKYDSFNEIVGDDPHNTEHRIISNIENEW